MIHGNHVVRTDFRHYKITDEAKRVSMEANPGTVWFETNPDGSECMVVVMSDEDFIYYHLNGLIKGGDVSASIVATSYEVGGEKFGKPREEEYSKEIVRIDRAVQHYVAVRSGQGLCTSKSGEHAFIPNPSHPCRYCKAAI